MSKRSTRTEKERTLIYEKDHQEEQKEFVLEIFKESINIDNGIPRFHLVLLSLIQLFKK